MKPNEFHKEERFFCDETKNVNKLKILLNNLSIFQYWIIRFHPVNERGRIE